MHKLFPNFTLKLGNLKMDGRNSFTIVAGAMIFPSILLTDLGVLSYISFGGAISSVIIVAAVLCVGTTKGVGFHEKGNLVNFKGLPAALSLYTFSYGGHAMFPAIYNSMKKKSEFPKVLLLSFITCTIIYASMAIVGYLMYGHNIQSQVTLNLPKEKISSKVAIYTILAGPIAKYALTIMPISTAIESCLPENYREKKPLRILIKMLLLVSTVVLAMLVPSFETVTSLTGALLIILVSFLLPCVCYLKIFKIYKHFGYELAGISGIILLAILVGVLGTYSAIAHIIKEA
ncbi:amino acid transporter AVT1I-like [Rhododendron vialii]|uniref:amino acid transporter AVT1I-like n=1 Tax=Rhododendron vialii TaxID=182163 RepID=UPI00265D7D0D|nr:amino acid transporter AVT1I-like [Rhododendron vialii]